MGTLRYLTAGESHGEELLGILEGMPSGMSLIAAEDIDPWLGERQRGYGRGRRQQIEQDTAKIVSGVKFGITTASPIGLRIQNRDWVNWERRMSVTPTEEGDQKPVTIPRPGHADLAGGIKYAHTDNLRNVLERASARETAMRVAVGAIGAKLLATLGIESVACVESIGSVISEEITAESLFDRRGQIYESEVRTYDGEAERKMIALIDAAKANGDTLGGTVLCVVRGMPIGVGSCMHWDRKLDGLLAQALMSIQAVKGVEIGDGFRLSSAFGSNAHDEISLDGCNIIRKTNHAGGIEGGMTNGEPVVVRVAMKPLSTLMNPLDSVDLLTGQAKAAHIERSDVTAVPALATIVRAVVSQVLAAALLDTFSGDSMDEMADRIEARRKRSIIPQS